METNREAHLNNNSTTAHLVTGASIAPEGRHDGKPKIWNVYNLYSDQAGFVWVFSPGSSPSGRSGGKLFCFHFAQAYFNTTLPVGQVRAWALWQAEAASPPRPRLPPHAAGTRLPSAWYFGPEGPPAHPAPGEDRWTARPGCPWGEKLHKMASAGSGALPKMAAGGPAAGTRGRGRSESRGPALPGRRQQQQRRRRRPPGRCAKGSEADRRPAAASARPAGEAQEAARRREPGGPRTPSLVGGDVAGQLQCEVGGCATGHRREGTTWRM